MDRRDAKRAHDRVTRMLDEQVRSSGDLASVSLSHLCTGRTNGGGISPLSHFWNLRLSSMILVSCLMSRESGVIDQVNMLGAGIASIEHLIFRITGGLSL